MIGDRIDKRKVLGISYSIQAILFGLLALLGMKTVSESFAAPSEAESAQVYKDNLIKFIFLFAGIGLVQSVDLPSLIAVMGNWTHRGNRGKITGLWSTC